MNRVQFDVKPQLAQRARRQRYRITLAAVAAVALAGGGLAAAYGVRSSAWDALRALNLPLTFEVVTAQSTAQSNDSEDGGMPTSDSLATVGTATNGSAGFANPTAAGTEASGPGEIPSPSRPNSSGISFAAIEGGIGGPALFAGASDGRSGGRFASAGRPRGGVAASGGATTGGFGGSTGGSGGSGYGESGGGVPAASGGDNGTAGAPASLEGNGQSGEAPSTPPSTSAQTTGNGSGGQPLTSADNGPGNGSGNGNGGDDPVADSGQVAGSGGQSPSGGGNGGGSGDGGGNPVVGSAGNGVPANGTAPGSGGTPANSPADPPSNSPDPAPVQVASVCSLLAGTDTIQGDLVVSGCDVHSPGHSPGAQIIDGDYYLDGLLVIELAGTTPGMEYDQLDVRGGAYLNGTIDVSLLYGFVPELTDVFDVILANEFDIGKNFQIVFPDLPGGKYFDWLLVDLADGRQALRIVDPAQIPGPPTLPLFLAGLAGFAVMIRRRRVR